MRSVMVPLELADVTDHRAEPRITSFECDRSELRGKQSRRPRAIHALGDDCRRCGCACTSIFRCRLVSAAVPAMRPRSCARQWSGAFGTGSRRDWLADRAKLGSDVPFFLAETAALVEGTGERVTPAGLAAALGRARRKASRRGFDCAKRTREIGSRAASATSPQSIGLDRAARSAAAHRLRRRRNADAERLSDADCRARAGGRDRT